MSYIKEQELLKEVTLSQTANKPTEKLHLMFHRIASNLIRTIYFPQCYITFEDAILDGYIKLVESYKSYKVGSNTSAFSYFTQICKNCFLQLLIKIDRSRSYHERVIYDDNGNLDFITADELVLEKELVRRKSNAIKKRQLIKH